MPTHIIGNLWLGNLHDAEKLFGKPSWITLNVLEKDIEETKQDFYIPILYRDSSGKYHLDWNKVFEASDLIEKILIENPFNNLLVHCGAGQERSPLVVQYWLVRHMGMNPDQAFDMIKKLRPEVIKCDMDYIW
jgi:protein-tyrosine phosphatase